MREIIFVNGAYFDNVLVSFGDAKIDYQLFFSNLATINGTEHVRTYYYHCPPFRGQEPTEEEQRRFDSKMGFFNALTYIPDFTVYLGQLSFRGYTDSGKPIFVRRLVDSQMALDICRLAQGSDIEQFSVVTGDNSLVNTIQYIKDTHGIKVKLCHGPQNDRFRVNKDLLDVCDNRFEITQNLIDSASQ